MDLNVQDRSCVPDLRFVGNALSTVWSPVALSLRFAAMAVGVGALTACTTLAPRSAAPETEIATAAPYGIVGEYAGGLVRTWGDEIGGEDEVTALQRAYIRRIRDAREQQGGDALDFKGLTLSGGGADGAYGAGLLNGWTASGTRPKFNIVTGVSTGAIISLFAFLGPDYDDELREVYTTYETRDLLTPTLFSALTGGSALTDTSGYRALIDRYVDDEVMARLGEEHARGRTLLIGTTNLDVSRPVVWNVSAIAATQHPEARRLVRDVIEASSAIPVAFPPVIIPVEGADGQQYDEMHVDGGATNQVFLFSPQIPLSSIDGELGIDVDREVYVVFNNKLSKPFDPVRPRLLPIAAASASSLIGGSGTGDVYKIFAIAQRDDIDLNIISIPRDFDEEPQEPFDPAYMRALYDLGYEHGLAGDRWQPHPPGYTPG